VILASKNEHIVSEIGINLHSQAFSDIILENIDAIKYKEPTGNRTIGIANAIERGNDWIYGDTLRGIYIAVYV
jgi:hypothetical protein